MTELHIDFETRSAADLRVTGSYIYAQHPTTDVWCAAYAFGDEPIQLWTPMFEDCPDDLRAHIESGGIMVAHNAAFERVIFEHIMGPRYGWPVPKLEQWRCTMAMAYAMALPGSLEEAAGAVGLAVRKDMSGRRLMLQMAKPRREEGDTLTWWDDDDRLQRLYAYCRQDVEVERQLGKRLMALRPQEQEIWFLDQRINDRGVYIDKKLCDAALKVVSATQALLDNEMRTVTNGAVRACGEVSNLVKFLATQGAVTESVNKETIDEMLGGWELTPAARRALELRKEAAKTSTAKIKKMLEMRADDGRMRGNLQYHGAGTGRWAARGAQLQNLPRPNKDTDVASAIDTILQTANPELIDMCHGPPLSIVSDCIRGMIAAPEGHSIMAADFAAIEARVVAWLAGQTDVVNLFAAGAEVYCRQAERIYNRPIDKKKDPDERQVGKVAILALGYAGGANAFAKMAGNYGIKLEPLFEPVWAAATAANQEKAVSGYEQRGKTSKLARNAWLAAECIKLAWRDANDSIVQYWYALENAAMDAVKNPGKQYPVGNVSYKVAGSFLWCRLPSGRVLCYPYPRIKTVEVPWGEKQAIVYKCVDSITRKWADKSFYGGLACENITQAVARDLMAEAMLRVNDKGYAPTITIHDEIVCEIPDDFGSLEEFEELMTFTPSWAQGCPIAAESWRGKRYKK